MMTATEIVEEVNKRVRVEFTERDWPEIEAVLKTSGCTEKLIVGLKDVILATYMLGANAGAAILSKVKRNG